MPRSRARYVLALVACLCCRQAEPEDPVLLALGDQTVCQSDFERHLAAVESQGGSTLEPTVRAALLEAFLEERVLVLEARQRGLLAPDGDAGEEQEAVRQLLAEAALGEVTITDEAVERYYAEHADAFQVPETVTLRQILVPTLNEARDVRRRLLRDPRSFERLARTLSRAPEATDGGLMGTFSRGELPPELEQVAFALQAGATSSVITTPLGYHVLRVEARQQGHAQTLEECRGEIQARLSRVASEQRIHQFVRGLLARARVKNEASPSAHDS
jgi:parvulin-like peptidyl-prolyl isomerase